MKCIKFEKPKEELYLTLSVILQENIENNNDAINKIINIQKNLINNNEVIKDANKLQSRLQNLKNKIIYQYPKGRLHFSVINFLTFKLVNHKSFKNRADNIKKQKYFKDIKKIVKSIKPKIKEVDSRIKRIYAPKRIGSSLALNLYIDNFDWFKNLEKIKEKIKKEFLSNSIPNNEVEIKAYPEDIYEYFAINIFRFINKNEQFFYKLDNIYEKIKKENKKLRNNPISFKIKKFTLVISDPYLANKDYEIKC